MPRVSWRDVERAFLVFGFLGACAALLTGDIAKEIARPNTQVVEYHEFFANLSAYLYGALLLGEVTHVLNTHIPLRLEKLSLKGITLWLERVLCNEVVTVLLAVFGFIAITVTGMLGGIMVYGTSADPFAPTLLKILGISF